MPTLETALRSFFTNTVDLPECPPNLSPRAIWLEVRDGWQYPWRIVGYDHNGIAQGYPCGEPRKGC